MQLGQPGQRRVLWLAGVAGALLLGIILVSAFAPGGETGYEPGPDLRPAGSGEPGSAGADGEESAGVGQASTQDQEGAPEEPGTQAFSLGPGDLISLAWRLGLVIAIIALAVVALRWWAGKSTGPRSSTGFLRVVDTLSVGDGRTIHLVALGDRVIVVGATQQSLSYLNELTPEETEDVTAEPDGPADQPFGGFAAQLMENLRSGRTTRFDGDPISMEEPR